MMTLSSLLSGLDTKEVSSLVSKSGATEVFGVSSLSQEIRPGWVFVAVRGNKKDGHSYLSDAIQNGAVAVIVEDPRFLDLETPAVLVANSREALDVLASQFYQRPSESLFCFGVTGTNGKTSITYMIEHVLQASGFPTGVLGTINHHLGQKIWPSEMTTPGPVQLHARLAEMKAEGAKAIAMEISSHALDQHRADAVNLNCAIFTNLTRDHLDYHGSMLDYFQAKQRLFTDLLWQSSKPLKVAVINVDDAFGRRLRVAAPALIMTYGEAADADFRFQIGATDFSRTEFTLQTSFGKFSSFLPMCGRHNVANAVAVVAACLSAGVPVSKSLDLLSRFPGVPGRLQGVPSGKPLHVFVDYAHTPDALENVLKSLQQVKASTGASGTIWTIFGCGGDRDKGKRPDMARIACQLSDKVMITSDNPRTEEPQKIIQEIKAGVPLEKLATVYEEVDRRSAFEKVFALARPQDVILIAGKGHEDYQIVGETKKYFSDLEVARELLS